ncbi:MAG: hypothetical protein KDA80_04565 [Planctomycetaceae bacterium]|nr:hypothetical protein [Planctomycetaceae bacterium]
MSFVGKILVVMQVVMSLLFMAFAGAVFAIHGNWREKANEFEQALKTSQQTLQVVQEELTNAKRQHTAEIGTEQTRANQFQAKNAALLAEVANLQALNNQLETQRETQTGLAESKGAEAEFRQAEAEKQRIENEKLQAALDKTNAELRTTKDDLFTRNQSFQQLEKQKLELEEKAAFLEKIVKSEGLETDPKVVAKLELPPPPVEGVVADIKKARNNNVNLVEITVGSDDGLIKGHLLDVFRVTDASDADWLGQIKIVELYPDTAVGEVVLTAKNGIIQEGDNVTSKLR